MALGIVTVDKKNLNQAEPTAIENLFLYIGKATEQVGDVVRVNTQTDFYKQFGKGSLADTLTTALLNAGSEWNAVCVGIDDSLTWGEALTIAMKRKVSPEAIIICDPVSSTAEIVELNNQLILNYQKYGRRMFGLAPTVGIDSANQSWAEYTESQRLLLDNLVCEQVAIVPQLHGNNLGVLAGRLANSNVSVADSPMRVATGALVGLGENPVDKKGDPLEMDTLTAIDAIRLSVPQTYEEYTGWYWGDCNLLANETSDYQVIEYLRVADKACRRVYSKLVPKVGDRSINQTAESMAWLTSYLGEPLRKMAKSTTINNVIFPGDIEPPETGDIVVQWASRTQLTIYIMISPLYCPKKITASLMLDLSHYA